MRYAHSVDSGDLKNEQSRVGLCASCTHSRHVTSDRGVKFYLCELSKTDSHFAKYPRLPVLSCSGYAPEEAQQVR